MKFLILNFLVFHCIFGLDPDIGLDMIALATNKGYTAIEAHKVTTYDGYILGLFRIPKGRKEEAVSSRSKPVVFLQHGLLDSSFAWISNFPSNSLGFILADNGYDVWFGNSRGNFYSTAHIKFPVNSSEFWDFTWDDMAQYDLPAAISYVLKMTGAEKLSYIGHSQGTIQALAAFSSNSSINPLINFAALLAPVAYAHHASGLLPLLATLDLDTIFMFFGIQDFLPDSTILQKLAPDICDWIDWGCEDILFLIIGSSHNLNTSRIEVYVSHTPSGTSVKNMAHWAQGVQSEVFQHYDYGSPTENFLHYGSYSPPPYNLKNVNVPLALYYGGSDILATPTDVLQLIQELPQSTIVKTYYSPGMAHLDFTWGYNPAALAVFDDVLAQLNKVNKKGNL